MGIIFTLFLLGLVTIAKIRPSITVYILTISLMGLVGCSETDVNSADQNQKKDEIHAASTENQKDEIQAASPSEQETKEEKSTGTSGTIEHVPVTLVKAIDGDTIKVRYNGKEQNVRYLLIDTPETNHPRLGKQPFGEEAKELNTQLVNSGDLTLEFDIGERVDKYGRLLAYVYVDGKSVQEILLEEGLARVAYVYPPNTRHLTPYEEAQKRAKEKGIGIWSIENYATDSGFKESSTGTPGKSQEQASDSPASKPNNGTEYFQNCTELRKVYPNGVPESHSAYQPKMDRDKDGYACER
ncbi:thermonuclease family protein [Siminovitchia fordii]|uniref:SPBc2 prophage-derived endonuclease YokF n=1 Tax=Siminovitchia fordii TaxID=254759 RepID=A0ABQ4KAF1_9BACI|nr:thermonuclease family protein [Siminovitchia fordii]GIN22704.1 SPBc2 prophage-derived endonuclease YokF [Siminovitchia fordii]